MQRASLRDYPRLLTEGSEEPGLVAFIRDRMIDLEVLEGAEQDSEVMHKRLDTYDRDDY